MRYIFIVTGINDGLLDGSETYRNKKAPVKQRLIYIIWR
jgi:hypothetical protein